MSFQFKIAGSQINGARDSQEDAFLITRIGDSGTGDFASLVIIADGMGGHSAGNLASNLAVQTLNKHITSYYPTSDIPQLLHEGVKEANNGIAHTVKEAAALQGMGCTLIGVIFGKSSIYWVSVGDSHLYLLRHNELQKKNADHSYGAFLDKIAAGGKTIDPEPGYSRRKWYESLPARLRWEAPEQAPVTMNVPSARSISADSP